MSTTPLSTDFKDDILASANPKRKYQMIYNDDGSVSFTDVTQYDQMGSIFGAKEVNEERAAINNIDERRLVTLDEIGLVTEEGYFVDAKAAAELNRKWSDELTGNNQYCKYRYVKFGKTAIIIGNLTANSNNNISITFPFEFKLTPSASVTLESSASSTINPLITQISTTSFRADSTPGSTTKTAARFIIIGEIE